jgi:hypothetical protein
MPFRPFAHATHRSSRLARVALLWLALVLALAQTVAIRHAYSHAPGETASSSSGKHPGGLAHCHSCIVAASVGGAAPPTSALLFAATQQQLPHVAEPVAQHAAPRQRPYAIRAPPVSAT